MATSPMEKVTNNSDTNYCKMPDGTLMCWGNDSIQVQGNSRNNMTITYPHAFNTNPSVALNKVLYSIATSGTETINMTLQSISKSEAVVLVGNTGSGTITVPFYWIAIGRWK